MILGGGGWDRATTLKLQKWLEAQGLLAGTSFRCQDLLDNRSPSFAGDVGIGINPKLAQRVKEADVLLVIGARLGEMTTSAYTLVEAPLPRQTLVHVHAGAEELGRVYRPAMAINSGYPQFIAEDLAGYVELAVGWANRLDELAALRSTMREQMRQSPLCDAPQFARDFLTVLRQAWDARVDAK